MDEDEVGENEFHVCHMIGGIMTMEGKVAGDTIALTAPVNQCSGHCGSHGII